MLNQLFLRYLRGPEHPAKLRMVRWLGRYAMPTAGVIAPVGPILKLYLHPRDWVEYLLLRGVAYEPHTLRFIANNLASGDGAILAGTNFGLHVATAAQAVGPEGLVLGVEPQPAALLRTRSNLELNGLQSRVRLISAALGRNEALVGMAWSRPDNPGAASILDDGEQFSTPLMRLDSIKALLERRRFRLLLLDVQGYELEALAGLDLGTGPDCAIVEIDPTFIARAGIRAEQIGEIFLRVGYSLFDVQGVHNPDLLSLPERNLVALKHGAGIQWGSGQQ